MSLSYFQNLMTYNVWANAKMFSWLNSLTEEQWVQPQVSSFPNIRETSLHVLGAEYIWMQRLLHVDKTVWIPEIFKGSNQEILKAWTNASADLETFLKTFTQEKLWETVEYKKLDGATYDSKYFEIFAHVVNHSSYHRGQLVTMLRQVGFTGVTSLDMINFYREINFS
jgi:uncharacterized damage-inducible protein DinB